MKPNHAKVRWAALITKHITQLNNSQQEHMKWLEYKAIAKISMILELMDIVPWLQITITNQGVTLLNSCQTIWAWADSVYVKLWIELRSVWQARTPFSGRARSIPYGNKGTK
jgi:hypothetical protein